MAYRDIVGIARLRMTHVSPAALPGHMPPAYLHMRLSAALPGHMPPAYLHMRLSAAAWTMIMSSHWQSAATPLPSVYRDMVLSVHVIDGCPKPMEYPLIPWNMHMIMCLRTETAGIKEPHERYSPNSCSYDKRKGGFQKNKADKRNHYGSDHCHDFHGG